MPILIPFLLYTKPMLDCESLKVSAVVTNKLDPDQPYLAEDDVVLVDPPISVTVSILTKISNKKPCLKEEILSGFKRCSKAADCDKQEAQS